MCSPSLVSCRPEAPPENNNAVRGGARADTQTFGHPSQRSAGLVHGYGPVHKAPASRRRQGDTARLQKTTAALQSDIHHHVTRLAVPLPVHAEDG